MDITKKNNETVVTKLYLEQLRIGQCYQFGHYQMTEQEIIKFGRAFDPQYFHTVPELAKESKYLFKSSIFHSL